MPGEGGDFTFRRMNGFSPSDDALNANGSDYLTERRSESILMAGDIHSM